MENLGKKLKELRREKNLTIKELSKIFVTSSTTISRWENETRTPSLDILLLYAKYFNVSLDYIAGLEN